MKKLLGIVVLGLLWSSVTFSKELKLKCTYKYIDTEYPIYKVGEDVYLVYDLSSKEYIVTEGYIKSYLVSKISDNYYLNYSEIHRLSGEKIEKAAQVEKSQFLEFEYLDMKNKDLDAFNKISRVVNRTFYEIKTSKLNNKPMWGEWKSDCEIAKKKF